MRISALTISAAIRRQNSNVEVTDILMNEEKESLHNWEVRQIYVKQKNHAVAQYVSETILTLRWFLVDRIINELKNSVSSSPDSDNSEILAYDNGLLSAD